MKTIDGRTLYGEVGIEAGGFKVRLTNGTTEQVELQRVAQAQWNLRTGREAEIARLKGNDLLGAYFDRQDLSGKPLQRLDENIDFVWGESWPVPGIPPDHFSVRWTGQIEVPATGDYTFILNCDDGARLWIDRQLAVDHWQPNAGGEFRGRQTLAAGRQYDFKLEYFDQEHGAQVRLFWEAPGLGRQVIPRNCFFTTTGGVVSNAITAEAMPAAVRRRGVLSRDGSFLAWAIRGVDDRGVNFHGLKDFVLPLSQLARIQYRDLTPEMSARVQGGLPGVLLGTREFIEGEVKSIGERSVKISSVLFGLRSFETGGRAAAIVLRDVVSGQSRYELKLRNGSLVKADQIECLKGGLWVRDGALRGLKVSQWEVEELRVTTHAAP
ncbi:MAG: hypothetical protein HZA90_18085 [Verrucomicrobia bacterium]|nr:hypothetical protein [Verrucomicrobiota bacterium]